MPTPFALPPDLQEAISRQLAGMPAPRSGVKALTRTYGKGGASAAGMDFAAYLAARLPATYAAVSACLAEVPRAIPGFSPASLLDAGAGPGTASWAAAMAFPGLAHITMLDNNPAFLALARTLAAHGPPSLKAAGFQPGDLRSAATRADLVVAAYALAELPEAEAAATAAHLWLRAGQALLLVEPGTPRGFARLRAARERLAGQGAVIAAPCSHALACPMAGDDWCHFSVRLARSRAHLHAKGARVPFEDEPYAYLLVTRLAAAPAAARILSPPADTKFERRFKLCHAGAVVPVSIATRKPNAYKQVRKLDWGERFPPDLME